MRLTGSSMVLSAVALVSALAGFTPSLASRTLLIQIRYIAIKKV